MIIENLKNIQAKTNLTDQQFADKLGIRRGSWNRIKNQRVSISDKFLVRAHKAFPELGIFLHDDFQEGKRDVLTNTITTPETHHNQKISPFRRVYDLFLMPVRRLITK